MSQTATDAAEAPLQSPTATLHTNKIHFSKGLRHTLAEVHTMIIPGPMETMNTGLIRMQALL